MPDVGHFPMLEAPDPFNALLREVVARLTRDGTPLGITLEKGLLP